MRYPALRRFSPLLCALAAVGGAGCRHAELTESGFLSDYAALSLDLDQRARMSYVAPDVDWASYTKAVIEPLEIRLQTTSNDSLEPGQEEKLRRFYRETMEQELAGRPQGRLEVTDVAGPGTLRVRAALTEVDCINVTVNTLTTIFIFWPFDFGGGTFELEVLDSESGRQLAAIINADKASAWSFFQSFHRIGHICDASDETIEWVADTVSPPVPAFSD
ncbi:MAG: DUF3313 domain-containing protein [Planctomycetota bacterium]